MVGLLILELTLVCQLHLDLKEKESMRDLFPAFKAETSLRRIPQDGITSEDDCDNEDEDLQQEEGVNEDEKEGDDYELKWNQRRVQVEVADFDQKSGPIKVLSSQQTVKRFFDFMFSKKVLHLICSQTNIYAAQRMLLKPDPSWKTIPWSLRHG